MNMRLKQLRLELGLNQNELAARLHVTQSAISSFETGERFPDSYTLCKMAELFDVSSDYLLGLSDARHPVNLNELTPEESNFLYEYKRLSNKMKLRLEAYLSGLLDAEDK